MYRSTQYLIAGLTAASIGRQGGHPQSWEMTLQMKWVSNTDTMEVRNEWNR